MEKQFIELYNKIDSEKRNLIKFSSGYQHKIFITDKLFGLCQYTTGSHWNLGGYSTYYVFNIDGSYIGAVNSINGLKESQKMKVTKAFLQSLKK